MPLLGKYVFYIGTVYGISLIVLLALFFWTLFTLRRIERNGRK